ncbi:MAG: adenylate kinase [Chloroflexi bacterium]|nr:adenylate kinase [Chloroflexota bacterium]
MVLLGPPGAGKGTQAARLSKELGRPHVSTGDLFRENLSKDTSLGRQARGYMESGQLVPDELVLEMLFDRVSEPDCSDGYLLDGFPRTQEQAEALERRLPSDWETRAVLLQVEDEVLIERATGRLVCKGCGNLHHEQFSPPTNACECDACGGKLEKRKDDRAEVVRERLEVYRKQTRPLVDFYRRRGVLDVVDGSREPDVVYRDLVSLLGSLA